MQDKAYFVGEKKEKTQINIAYEKILFTILSSSKFFLC